ncbi:MAG: branched-chain amino acid ABC transporter permease [Halofilum sp. (in: g-proteobacteria)]|nr:branched-chain amino acid ABC transporter permease [Halofilum sp. (in: g-proteobacteria)]
MELAGLFSYLVFFLSMAGIYAVLALGLNVQWGYTGQINIGVAGFFAVGAYTAAILATPPNPDHLGGFEMPFVVGLVAAMIVAGILALAVGLITLKLRADYLAIATIGIAEIVRLFLKNEDWLTNGVRGIASIPGPLAGHRPGIGRGRRPIWSTRAGARRAARTGSACSACSARRGRASCARSAPTRTRSPPPARACCASASRRS